MSDLLDVTENNHQVEDVEYKKKILEEENRQDSNSSLSFLLSSDKAESISEKIPNEGDSVTNTTYFGNFNLNQPYFQSNNQLNATTNLVNPSSFITTDSYPPYVPPPLNGTPYPSSMYTIGPLYSTVPSQLMPPSSLYMIPNTNLSTGMTSYGITPVNERVSYNIEVKKCHLHSKPQLTCKFCRKYKSIAHQQPRLLVNPELYSSTLHDINGTSWVTVEMTNTTTFNMNSLLRENILASEYYKSLYSITTFEELVDEIFNFADHAEPYCAGNLRAPSTLFCCIYKLFTMRLKEHQVHLLLDYRDSSYVRVAGLLYLRYVLPLEKLWDWFCPYFLDDEVFSAGVDKTKTTTIGEFCENLITEDRYFATILPRIPVKIKTQDGAQLIPVPTHRKWKAHNRSHIELFNPGVPVAACVDGEWVKGKLLSVEALDTGQASCQVQIDDDYVKLVDLGLVIVLEAKIRAIKRREDRKLRWTAKGLPPPTKRQRNKNRLQVEQSDLADISVKSKSHLNSDLDNPSSDIVLSHDKLSESSYNQGNDYDEIEIASNTCQITHSSKKKGTSVKENYFHTHSKKSSSSHKSNGGYSKYEFSPHKRHCKSPPSLHGSSRPETQSEVLAEFLRREKEKALASGRAYARKPSSYKSSLSLRFETTSTHKKGKSPTVTTVYVNPVLPKSSTEMNSNDSNVKNSSKSQPTPEQQKKMNQLIKRYTKH